MKKYFSGYSFMMINDSVDCSGNDIFPDSIETDVSRHSYINNCFINAISSRLFLISFLSLFVCCTKAIAQTGNAKGVATFNCIGITWSGSGGNANTACDVQYRIAGSNSPWQNGYPLWFDNRKVGRGTNTRPANEYRGSIVGLKPGTAYQIQLTAGSAKNGFIINTWKETFPVGASVKVSNSHKTLEITTSGTATGYRLYSPGEGRTAAIDVVHSSPNCIYINASYIIIRGLILKGANEDAILLGPNAHDVVIENNDISGWGSIGAGAGDEAGIRVKGLSYYARNVERIIIQRNKIHHPQDNSNSWDDGGHPLGPVGINFEEAGGNHVIRYNEIYSDSAHYFMDGIGGSENFSFGGFPNCNSDIYANKISQAYDDGIESEGGNCNVRIWGNFTNYTFTGVACATNSIGPLYIFRNVSNVSQRSYVNASPGTIDNEDRGPFNKCGSQDSTVRGGRTFLFHNTILQPIQFGYTFSRGMGGGPVDNGGPVSKIFSRNNIWQTYREGTYPSIAEWQSANNSGNSYDFDLYNGELVITSPALQEFHGIKGYPTYASGLPLNGPNPEGYFLAPGSKGLDKGLRINNFNDGFTGVAPDIGAYETGKPALQFGVNAGLNQPPMARTANDLMLASPIATVQLNGSISSDTDGLIVSYVWKQVAGPGQATITGNSSAVATISDLKPGIYIFELEVTDNEGASSTKTVKIMAENNPEQKPTFIVYPNPASDVLNMQYVSRQNGKFRIAVYDADMRLLWNEIIHKNQLFLITTVDITNYPPGIYFSQISSFGGKEKSLVKFIKM